MSTEVVNQGLEVTNAVPDHAESNVALVAEQAANETGFMIVVDVVSPLAHGGARTDLTNPALLDEHGVELFDGDAVKAHQVLRSVIPFPRLSGVARLAVSLMPSFDVVSPRKLSGRLHDVALSASESHPLILSAELT